jgi:NAD(P)-dependent dehydrogenase (short-subunit alcohol dehydrogenase family)
MRVNAVAPTFMDTPFWREMSDAQRETARQSVTAAVPLNRLATVGEVASTYVHLMTNGFITGQVLAIDGGIMLRR